MSGQPGRSGGWCRVNKPQPKPVLVFVGTPAPPTVCLRERCGQQVTIHGTADPKEPITWSCLVGHGGVVNAKPELRTDPTKIPRGICQRCGTEPIPMKRQRGGSRGRYCTECIEQGRRLFAAGNEAP